MARRAREHNAKPMVCREGYVHRSSGEARRCDELHLMQLGGAVAGLVAHPQPSWDLVVKGVQVVKVGRYTADFQYLDQRSGKRVVEDYKGGPVSRDVPLRLKLMLALHGIEVWVNRGGQR